MNIPLPIVLIAALVAAVAFTFWIRTRGSENRKRKKMFKSGAAWAVMFLSSGRMPPPPPQSQIEEEVGERKNREIRRSEKD